MNRTRRLNEHRLRSLESQLQAENPILVSVLEGFLELDAIAHRMRLLDGSESYADRIPWWPMISVMGTFSAGKSSFINHYLGQEPLPGPGRAAVRQPGRGRQVHGDLPRRERGRHRASGKWPKSGNDIKNGQCDLGAVQK